MNDFINESGLDGDCEELYHAQQEMREQWRAEMEEKYPGIGARVRESMMLQEANRVVNDHLAEQRYWAQIGRKIDMMTPDMQHGQGGEWNGAQSQPMTHIQEPPALPPLVVVVLVVFVVYLLVLLADVL